MLSAAYILCNEIAVLSVKQTHNTTVITDNLSYYLVLISN